MTREKIDITPFSNGGVLKTIKEDGEGRAKPSPGCRVKIQYVGKFDGNVFDSSRDHSPSNSCDEFYFVVGDGKVIKGVDIGVQSMEMGELAEFILRSDYAFGESETWPGIPGGATVLFTVKLVSWCGDLIHFQFDTDYAKKNEELTRQRFFVYQVVTKLDHDCSMKIVGDSILSPDGLAECFHVAGSVNVSKAAARLKFDDRELSTEEMSEDELDDTGALVYYFALSIDNIGDRTSLVAVSTSLLKEKHPDKYNTFLLENPVKAKYLVLFDDGQLAKEADKACDETTDLRMAYEKLKLRCESGPKCHSGLSWRLSKICYQLATQASDQNRKKQLTMEGHSHAVNGYNSNKKNVQAIKWAAVMTKELTAFLGGKEKIKEEINYKSYLDKALAIDAKEFCLLHMRGLYTFSLARLSWLERKAAAVFFASVPTATYEEALIDFLAAYDSRPEWIDNLYYIGKTYFQKNDKNNARKYLQLALNIKPANEAEKSCIDEAGKLISKC